MDALPWQRLLADILGAEHRSLPLPHPYRQCAHRHQPRRDRSLAVRLHRSDAPVRITRSAGLFFGIWLKALDAKNHYGLELPNIKADLSKVEFDGEE